MPPVGYVVFDKDGQAGIHCGTDHEGNEIVAWIGTPAVVTHEVDEAGDGAAAYSTQYPTPEDSQDSRKSWR